jgi:death on curing protein
MNEPHWLNDRDVIAFHREILAESGGSLGILNQGALESTLHKAQNLYYYSDRQATLYELAAAYGYGLVKNHCFIDGNKRIALIVVYTFLAMNGVELTASEIDAAQYFLELAASQVTQETEMQKLAKWLKAHSQKTKKYC